MPKKEQTIRNYRPELAKKLKMYQTVWINSYTKNKIIQLYQLISSCIRHENPEYADLLNDAANCLENTYYAAYEIFMRDYYDKLNKIPVRKYNMTTQLGDISEAYAAGYIAELEKPIIKMLKENTLQKYSDLTLAEKYDIDRFFNILASPLYNPNIVIQKNETKCYYDKHPYDSSYSKDLKSSLDYIKEHCTSIIEIYNIPD